MSGTAKLLENEGYRFAFFQAIRLLESVRGDRPAIGHLGPFEKEAVHIRPNVDLGFSPGDIKGIAPVENADGDQRWEVIENFLGLYGPNTAAPIFVAEMVAQCPVEEDALKDFLDIFNHRILSLYYRAWKKYNLTASISPRCDDPLSLALQAMVGHDARASHDNWVIPPERLLRYSGYFSSSARPADGLVTLLQDFFSIEGVRVVQFVPRKFKARTSDHCTITNKNTGGRLGASFVLGDTIRDIAGQFKICFDELDKDQFEMLQPGRPAHQELVFLVNLYTKNRLDFSVELNLKADQATAMRISHGVPTGMLGRSSWMGSPADGERSVILDASREAQC